MSRPDYTAQIEQAEQQIRILLWRAYNNDSEWSEVIEAIKPQLKLIHELSKKEREWWEDYNEPVK